MEELGRYNLFTSHFIIGAAISDNVQLDCITAIKKWLIFKNSANGMEKHRVNKTQYVDFLHEIDIKEFEICLNDFVKVYKKAFPHGKKRDFIKHIFEYSLYDLQNFINREYKFLGSPSNKSNYDYYYFYEVSSNEYLDFAISSKKTIEHYKQYYKKVIQLINDVPFNQIHLEIERKEDLDEIKKTTEIDSSNVDTQLNYEAQEWAAIFCYAYPFIINTKDGFKSKNLQNFMEKHKVDKSFAYLRGKCYDVNKDIHNNYTFSVEILENTIKPFLKIHYPHTLSNIDDDIQIIKNESHDY